MKNNTDAASGLPAEFALRGQHCGAVEFLVLDAQAPGCVPTATRPGEGSDLHLMSSIQALLAAPEDADKHAAYLAALNKENDPSAVLLVAELHRDASNPAVVVEVCPAAIVRQPRSALSLRPKINRLDTKQGMRLSP